LPAYFDNLNFYCNKNLSFLYKKADNKFETKFRNTPCEKPPSFNVSTQKCLGMSTTYYCALTGDDAAQGLQSNSGMQ
jgi:hypothetical protein